MGGLGKLGVIAVVANEVRGAAVFAAGIGDLHTNGVRVDQLWLAPLILAPILAAWVWKRHTMRRRIARRLRGVCAG